MPLLFTNFSMGKENEFYAAAVKGDDARLTALLATRPNTERDLGLGLYGACEGGHFTTMTLMLANGANDLTRGLDGACTGCQLEFMQLMLDKLNVKRMTPDAAKRIWNECLEYLCWGAYKNNRRHDSRYLFWIRVMIERGADDFGPIVNHFGDIKKCLAQIYIRLDWRRRKLLEDELFAMHLYSAIEYLKHRRLIRPSRVYITNKVKLCQILMHLVCKDVATFSVFFIEI